MTSAVKGLALYLLLATSAWAGPILPRAVTCEMKPDDAEYGLIVLSASIPESDLVSGVPQWITYEYGKAKGIGFFDSTIVASRVSTFLQSIPSDFEKSYGRFFVIKLKSGDYELRRWSYVDRMNYAWQSNPPRKIPFHVAAARATYLGSLEPQLITGKNLIGQDVARIFPTLVDQSRRDLSMLMERCPTIDIMQVDVSLLDLSPWLQK